MNSTETDSPVHFYDPNTAPTDDEAIEMDPGGPVGHEADTVQMLRLRVSKSNSSSSILSNPIADVVVPPTEGSVRSERSASAQSFISSITSGSAEGMSAKESASGSASERRSSAASMADSVVTSNDGAQQDADADERSTPSIPNNGNGGPADDNDVPNAAVSANQQSYGFGQVAPPPPSSYFASSFTSIFQSKSAIPTGKATPVPLKLVNKRRSEFDGLYRTQSIRVHQGVIWTLKFSPDG